MYSEYYHKLIKISFLLSKLQYVGLVPFLPRSSYPVWFPSSLAPPIQLGSLPPSLLLSSLVPFLPRSSYPVWFSSSLAPPIQFGSLPPSLLLSSLVLFLPCSSYPVWFPSSLAPLILVYLESWLCFGKVLFTVPLFFCNVFVDLGYLLLLSISYLFFFAYLLLLHSNLCVI